MDHCSSEQILERDIFLRRLDLADAEPMLEWLKDPSIYEKMQYDPEEQTLERCIAFIKKSWTDTENLHYAVTNSEKEYLGTVSLKNVDRKNCNAELGIVICPKAMGRGIAAKALREIMRIAFEELDLNKVYLYVRCDNERAVAFYHRNRMPHEGCFKKHIYANGAFRDIDWFSLTRDEYPEWK